MVVVVTGFERYVLFKKVVTVAMVVTGFGRLKKIFKKVGGYSIKRYHLFSVF